MINDLIEQLESLVGSDDFEYESEEIMDRMTGEGAGFETVEKLLSVMERHPLDDFGMPGAVVHFIEQYHPAHIPLLISSIRRAPAMHTLWMLNRCINAAGDKKEEYISVLREAAVNEQADKAVRDEANMFLGHQNG